ncbi:MAG TPA: fibronectin type III domain-containing protein, partial [Ilumatobacteraceae bacterium]|nr:fibronectin type III domain-containing protein [Ilumatobacteraceae bacterium]
MLRPTYICWGGYRPMATIRTTGPITHESETVTVTSDALHGWGWLTDGNNPNATVTPRFTTATDTSGEDGSGSYPALQANVPIIVATNDYDGVKLADLTALSYDTYSSRVDYAPSLALDVRLNSSNVWQGRLVFIASGDTSGWKTWDTFEPTAGLWYASNATASGGNCRDTLCTWDEVLTNWPDAMIDNPDGSSPGRLSVRAGTTDPDYSAATFHVDHIVVGAMSAGPGTLTNTVTTFDFEPQLPTVPRFENATPGDGRALLKWTRPVSDGGLPITGYVVTTPDGGTCTVSGTSALCTGLTNGSPYGFTVAAVNDLGTGPAVAIGPVTPAEHAVQVVAYDSIGLNPQGNYASLGYQATQTSEFGDLVEFAPGPRTLDDITVQFSSWACETGSGTSCLTTPGSTFDHPITVTVYAVDESGPTPVVGAVLATMTKNVAVPYRPSANATCAGGTTWKAANGTCYNGFAFTERFDFPEGITVPDRVIWAVSYNTQTWGYDPIGLPGPYTSLNVGADSRGSATAFVGTDVNTDTVFWATRHAPFYCDDGAGGTNTLREDCDWTGNRPMATIRTQGGATDTTVELTVTRDALQGWEWLTDGNNPNVAVPAVFTADTNTSGELGSGSYPTLAPNEPVIVSTNAYDGVKLADISELGYETYSSRSDYAPGLSLDVKLTPSATTWQGRLVFVPSGTTNGWQTWDTLDATNGLWYASNQTAAAAAGRCGLSALCTWDQVLTYWPQAQVGNPDTNNNPLAPGRLSVRAGITATDYSADTFHVDHVVVGVVATGVSPVTNTITTYDFEPSLPAAPTAVIAVAGDTTATVSWTAPDSGGTPLQSYTVTSAPGAKTCTATAPATT